MPALARLSSVRAGVVLSISTAGACTTSPDFDASTDESTASSSSSTTIADDHAACACVEPPSYGVGLVAPTCGPLLCETQASCPSGGTYTCLDDPGATHDEAGLSCALEALLARTPGYIEWGITFTSEENTFEAGHVVILDDGRAITQSSRTADFGKEYRGATLGPLPAHEQLEACAASTSPVERFECLVFVPDQPQIVCEAPS